MVTGFLYIHSMKKYLLLISFALMLQIASAQISKTEEESIKKVINTLFDGMRKGDSSMVNSAFNNKMVLQTIINREGNVQVRSEEPAGFLKAVGTPHQDAWDERITFDQILIDGNLASVWTKYKFYAGNKFSHCGVNSFQLVKGNKGWKIVYLIDTRRKDNCD